MLETVRPWVPHEPSQKQREFLELAHTEALYGGAAGGGKSDALLMAALQFVDVPGYAALILRKTFADLNLPDAIMARARQWLAGTAAKWNDNDKRFTFPSGATLSFGYLQTDGDKFRYQSAAFQFVGFDELTQFPAPSYLYLFSRLRRLKGFEHVPLRMRAATNPGGVGHEWVFNRFVANAQPVGSGVVKVTAPTAEEAELAKTIGEVATGTAFVPARLADNPGLDVASYRMQLAKLDPTTRRQLEQGDWSARPAGQFFREEWFQFVDLAPSLRWIRYWDLAATEPHAANTDPDWTAGVRLGIWRAPSGAQRIYIAHARRFRKNPLGVEDAIKATAEADGKKVPIILEQEPGSSGKNTIANYKTRVLFGWTVHGDKKTGDKESLWGPLAAQAEARNVYLVRGDWNAEFVAELVALPNGKKDQADAAAGALAWLTGSPDAARAKMLAGSK